WRRSRRIRCWRRCSSVSSTTSRATSSSITGRRRSGSGARWSRGSRACWWTVSGDRSAAAFSRGASCGSWPAIFSPMQKVLPPSERWTRLFDVYRVSPPCSSSRLGWIGTSRGDAMATVATDHYRAYTPKPFTRAERDSVTILFGGLHWRIERILQAVLEGSGYRAQILPVATKADLLTGRETADIGQCCPTSFTTGNRSEEHTSELQSRFDIVCRLLLEKKNIYEIWRSPN